MELFFCILHLPRETERIEENLSQNIFWDEAETGNCPNLRKAQNLPYRYVMW
jgi:hypothetical protein